MTLYSWVFLLNGLLLLPNRNSPPIIKRFPTSGILFPRKFYISGFATHAYVIIIIAYFWPKKKHDVFRLLVGVSRFLHPPPTLAFSLRYLVATKIYNFPATMKSSEKPEIAQCISEKAKYHTTLPEKYTSTED